MDRNEHLDRLKDLAASDGDVPRVDTLDPQIRTTRFAMFPDPKHLGDDEPQDRQGKD